MTQTITRRIADAHNAYNPTEALAARGPAALTNAELLGLVADITPEAARALLTETGSLRSLLEAAPDAAAKLPGMTRRRACKLSAALELSSRHLAEHLDRGAAMTDPKAAGLYFSQRLRAYPREVFAALFLDTCHRAIGFEELFRGTIDGSEVHPRIVVKRALELNAAAIIVGHNHPSGSPEPSAADRAVTAQLKQALSFVDVRLLDHFIIGDGAPVSLAMRGWV